MRWTAALVLLFSFQVSVRSQPDPRKIPVRTETVGLSAISIQTLNAKSYFLPYPIYDYAADSSSGLFVFSIRQRSDDDKNFLSRAFIGALDCSRDSLRWYSESNTYDIEAAGSHLYFSAPIKSNRVNLAQGFEEAKYASRLLFRLPGLNRGMLYVPAGSEAVSCVNLDDGAVLWTAAVSGSENWVDMRMNGDSQLVVAAAGLSALHPYKGLRWSFPLVTSQRVEHALTYSPADNNGFIRQISRVAATSTDDKIVTELSSNVFCPGDGRVFFASKEKMIAVDGNGKLLWELDLKNYPVSKMYLSGTGGDITLLNLGLARYADTYVSYGKPFVLQVNAESGQASNYQVLDSMENLVDVVETPSRWLFATRNRIVAVSRSGATVNELLRLDTRKYGSFMSFVDGDLYYTEKENFYAALNFINDNLLYFRADNNKIYGLAGGTISYEYHFNEIFHKELSFGKRLFLRGESRSLIISRNMDLLATLNGSYRCAYLAGKLVLIKDNTLRLLDAENR